MPPEEVIKRIKSLTLAGYKEIVITGINLGSYGKDFPLKFALTDLLNLICEKTPLERLRLSSIESLDINKAFLEMFNKYPVLCNHLHIPLQHGHNSILHNMNRNYTVEQYREIINLARERIKDLAITTDVMVGFPGEKEEYFSSTRNFLQEMQLSKIHVFSYSPRKGTVAFNMKEQVSEEIKNERSRILLELSKKMAGSFYRKFIGQSLSVLFEHRLDKKTGLLKGLTTNYIPVTIEGRENCFGKILMVNIIGLKEEALFGEIISEQ